MKPDKKDTIETKGNEIRRVLSKNNRNAFTLVVAIIFVAIISGILGAFQNGQFQRTYDFVTVNMELSEVDYDDPIFSKMENDSKISIITKKFIRYNQETQENYTEEVEYLEGYYTKFFYKSSWFYTETGLNTIMVIIFYSALVNFLISKRKEKDEVFVELSNDINDITIINNDLPSSTFEPFMKDWNIKRKVEQHIHNIKFKLTQLEKKTSYKIRKKFYKYETKEINGETKKIIKFIIPESMNKKESYYYNKKKELESFLEESYIQQNVPFDKIEGFQWIHPSFVNSGQNIVGKTTDPYSNIKSDGKKYSNDLMMKVIMGFAITGVIASVLSFTLISTTEHWLIIVYSVLMKMLPLILQIILAIDYTNKFMSYHAIPTIKLRLNIASLFLTQKSNFITVQGETIKKLEEERDKIKEELKEVKPNNKIGKTLETSGA